MEPDLYRLLRAILEKNDEGHPAPEEDLLESLGCDRPKLDRLLEEAKLGVFASRAGPTMDHSGSPIARANEGWMLLSAGYQALGETPPGPLDPSSID